MIVPQALTTPSPDRPALRQDITTGEWVIMAPSRAQRPQQLAAPAAGNLPPYDPGCPFCPGQEAHTPPPVLVVPDGNRPTHWTLRVVPNKFPALVADSATPPSVPDGLFPALDGRGHHEVIIECPEHNGQLSQLPLVQLIVLVGTWGERLRALQTDPQVQMISLFKNHGARAGASLPHPHTQILALPIRSAAVTDTPWRSSITVRISSASCAQYLRQN